MLKGVFWGVPKETLEQIFVDGLDNILLHSKLRANPIEEIWSALKSYRAFDRFVQAKFAYGGPVLGLSQFSILPQLPQKMMLASKVVKFNS